MVARKDKVDAHKSTEGVHRSNRSFVSRPVVKERCSIRQITREITMRDIARDVSTSIIAGLMYNRLPSTVSRVLN